MEDCQTVPIDNPPTFKKEKRVKEKTAKSSFKRTRKNRKHFRKRKNKLQFINYVKKLELDRKSRQASKSVQTTMGATAEEGYYPYALKEVADWQQKHEVSYWKSRAISLEYENKMLLEHIKKMHSKHIQEYIDYTGQEEEDEECTLDDQSWTENGGNSQREEARSDQEKPPTGDESAEKQELMKKLYGEKASVITGIETALQLNYDLNMDVHKPVYWPNLPFNP